jgi:methionyl-tRNA formyltransferase
MKDLRIAFFGTPDFATASLKRLVEDGWNIVAVITAPDKPSGRGQQLSISDVKRYALEVNLPIYQPEKLKAADFVEFYRSLNIDLAVVVAFRMMPEVIWSAPKIGTINLHGSLLPN